MDALKECSVSSNVSIMAVCQQERNYRGATESGCCVRRQVKGHDAGQCHMLCVVRGPIWGLMKLGGQVWGLNSF